jgi:hypothetical protein
MGKITRYEICDADGVIIAIHVREDNDDRSKKMWWELPDGTPRLNGIQVDRLPLFGSQLVRTWPKEAPVFISEGEKVASILCAKGYLALGTVCGASTVPWPGAFERLNGRDVILCPDNDESGERHMRGVAAQLERANSVRWLHWGDQPGDDLADFFARGGTEEQLDQLAADAPLLTDLGDPEKPPRTAAWLYEHGPEPTKGHVEGEAFSEKAVVLVVGRGGSGKTTLADAMSVAHARGDKLGYLKFSKGRALCISGEMSEHAKRRRLRRQFTLDELRALDDAFMIRCRPYPRLDFFAEPERSSLRLRRWIEKQEATIVFLDALVDIHTGDENSNRDMSRVFTCIRDEVAEPTGACVAILHHAGWPFEGSRVPRPRGASSMRDVCEDVLVIDQSKPDGPRRVVWDKNRWETLAPFGFTITKDEESGLLRLDVFAVADKNEKSSERRRQDKLGDIGEKVLHLLQKHGPLKTAELRERVGCRNEDLLCALEGLENQGAVRWKPGPKKARLWEATR